MNKQTNEQNRTRDMEIKNKLTVIREGQGITGERRGRVIKEHVQKAYGQSPSGEGLGARGSKGKWW